MGQDSASLEEAGLEVVDTQSAAAFLGRPRRVHSVASQLESLERIGRAFVTSPETILQELVDAAVVLCGADSAGISVEKEDATDEQFYHWVATAGQYSGFLNAVLPRYPSACGVCLERGRPQMFTVTQRFFDILGVEAPTVTDGILLPWKAGATRGTIFVMAHGRTRAFDEDDCRTMQILANFAAMAVTQQNQQRRMLEQTKAAASAEMANDLAHKINNPLQSLVNILFLARQQGQDSQASALAEEASGELKRLSALVAKLLALPLAGPK